MKYGSETFSFSRVKDICKSVKYALLFCCVTVFTLSGCGSQNTGTAGEEVTTPFVISATLSENLGKPRNFGASIGVDGQVILTWSPPNYGLVPDDYIIYRATSTGITTDATVYAVVTGSTTYIDTTVTNGVNYYYAVASHTDSGFISGIDERIGLGVSSLAVADANLVFADVAAVGGGDGSVGSPFNTISDAIANVNAGGTIVLQPGTYSVSTAIPVAKAVTIRSLLGIYQTTGGVIIQGANSYDINDWAVPENAFDVSVDDVAFTGLTFTQFSRASSANSGGIIDETTTINNLWITNNYFYKNGASAVATSNFTSSDRINLGGWRINDNKIDHVKNGANGLTPYQLRDCELNNNIITNVLGSSESGIVTLSLSNCEINGNLITDLPNSYAFKIGCGDVSNTDKCQNITARHNVFDNNFTVGSGTRGQVRIQAKFLGTTLTMTHNKIINSGAHGISVENGDISTFTFVFNNNHVANSFGNGINHNGAGTMVVENNYWGDAGGPNQGSGETLGGTGLIDADPFLTTSPLP